MSKDLLQVIDEEHTAIKQLFNTLRDDPSDINELIKFLVSHEVAEETVPFPIARKLPDGDRIVDARIDEQSTAEEELDRIESLDNPEDRKAALKKLEQSVIDHAEEEERTVYALLKEHCTKAQLEEMGEKFLKVKAIAPTHPHPAAPDTPPLNKVMGPAAGLADRLRDKVRAM